jgi:hypothetical protein
MKIKAMRAKRVTPCLVIAMAAFVFQPSFLGDSKRSSALKADAATRLKASEAYGRLPLSFEENRGQSARVADFISRGAACDLFLSAAEATIASRAAQSSDPGLVNGNKTGSMREAVRRESRVCGIPFAIRMKLAGANLAARPHALDRLPGRSNYLIGSDRKRWLTDIPNYAKVRYESVYPGVDLIYYGNRRQLEYDFNLAPGADFKAIRVVFDGAEKIRLDESGDLLIETREGELRQTRPVIYQEAGGAKRIIEGGYVIRGDREVGFAVGDYDQGRALVIDPVLVYSASIGGGSNDTATGIAVDPAGNAYITGSTTSADFPTLNPVQPRPGQTDPTAGTSSDAFVAKLNPSGTALVYSTYLGGADNDAGHAVAVDAGGSAYVTGGTRSQDFPVTAGAFQTANRAGDAFVAKLNPSGNGLIYSTYLGGSTLHSAFPFSTSGQAIAVDSAGNAYVTGYTHSQFFPTRRAAQGEFNNGSERNCCFQCLFNFLPPPSPLIDAFVTKLNPSGSGLAYRLRGQRLRDGPHLLARPAACCRLQRRF